MSRKKSFFAWLWVVLCALSIFLIIPLARTIQKFVSAHGGRQLFGYAVLTGVAIAFSSIIYHLIFRLRIRSVSHYIWLTVIAGLYVYFTLKLWRGPEEAVHFLEYGLLGYLLFCALSFSIKDKSIYPTAFLIGSLVGIFDEIIQWLVPNRYWDFRDAGINALAAGLIQVAIWKGLSPKILSEKIGPKSVRRVSILLAINLIILGICRSNTASRVAAYTKAVPALSFLQKEEPMYEFNKKYRDSEVGIFYSRLSLENLNKIDAANNAPNGQILKEWKSRDYQEFLRTYPSLMHPFLYEFRVHAYRRDKKLQEAEKAEGEKKRQEALFAAYKENLILEKYYGQTLQASSYQWAVETRRQIEASIDTNKLYKSPIGASLFININEVEGWAGILIFLAALAVFNLIYSRSHHSQEKA